MKWLANLHGSWRRLETSASGLFQRDKMTTTTAASAHPSDGHHRPAVWASQACVPDGLPGTGNSRPGRSARRRQFMGGALCEANLYSRRHGHRLPLDLWWPAARPQLHPTRRFLSPLAKWLCHGRANSNLLEGPADGPTTHFRLFAAEHTRQEPASCYTFRANLFE